MTKDGTGYSDDLSIPDDAVLWRRVTPEQCVKDTSSGEYRPSSAAFKDHPDGSPMSVLLADEVEASGRSAESVLAAYKGYGLVAFTAGLVRELGLGIVRSPLDYEPAHAEVFGRKTRSVRRTLARRCEWVIRPDPRGRMP